MRVTTAVALVMTDPVLAYNTKELTDEIIGKIGNLPQISDLANYISLKITNNYTPVIDPDDATLLQYIYNAREAAIRQVGLDEESLENGSLLRSFQLPEGQDHHTYTLSEKQLRASSCQDTFRLNAATENGVDSGVTFEVVDCTELSAVKLRGD